MLLMTPYSFIRVGCANTGFNCFGRHLSQFLQLFGIDALLVMCMMAAIEPHALVMFCEGYRSTCVFFFDGRL
ncbi:hypothetical protein [Limnohabitans sp.]|jgi:hypothetical protein|uniref:hypothetical protein n=1 Tax=Limnohabitans sp. TaxID=1907725 RepID=UPI0037C149A1